MNIISELSNLNKQKDGHFNVNNLEREREGEKKKPHRYK